jgi:hypothetical protein
MARHPQRSGTSQSGYTCKRARSTKATASAVLIRIPLELVGRQHAGFDPFAHRLVGHVQVFRKCRNGDVSVGMRTEIANAMFPHSGAARKKGYAVGDFVVGRTD